MFFNFVYMCQCVGHLMRWSSDVLVIGCVGHHVYKAVVPNLWPAGQKWPARPQKVALDLLKNFKNICATTAKFPFWQGRPVEIEKFLVALNAAKPLGTCQKRPLFALEGSKMRCRLGLRPRPRWGAYSAPPEPLAVGREGNDERRKEGEEGRKCKKLTLWPSMPSIKNKWPFKQKRLWTTAIKYKSKVLTTVPCHMYSWCHEQTKAFTHVNIVMKKDLVHVIDWPI